MSTGPQGDAWHDRPVGEVADRLGTDPERGLGDAEAVARLTRHGPNRIETATVTPWYRVAARQFTNVLIVILVVAAAVSLALGETVDAVTIVAIIVLNAVMGFVQEWKAERAIDALSELLAPHADVIRSGRQRTEPADVIVPGDVVAVTSGNRIPADLRIIRETNLTVDESPLTGESLPVAKDAEPVAATAAPAEQASMAWMGTTVASGHGTGIVVATGSSTRFGRIAELTQSVSREPTPLQRQLADLGRLLGILAVVIAGLVTAVGLARGNDLLQMALTGVSLAVAAIPEGLPAVVTVTLALGVRAMAQRQALIRRLPAAETLGAATVICTDKTGTITRNEMTVQEVWTPEGGAANVGSDPTPLAREVLLGGFVCSQTRVEPTESGEGRVVGEPTEAALARAALEVGIPPDRPAIEREVSFSSSRKRMTVVVAVDGRHVAYMKGGPEIVLDRCATVAEASGELPLTEERKRGVVTAQEAMAAGGLRTIAVARRLLDEPPDGLSDDLLEREFSLLGIAGILDPPRGEVGPAVADCATAGIEVVMITGDAPSTAVAVARMVGLDAPGAVVGSDVDSATDTTLRRWATDGTVFARATPENKLDIVRSLQEDGHVVAMTGDGVNDAPALKRADIGVAMGLRGTDVARGASDLVLADDNFASIVGAVAEGRRQHDNLTKFVHYLLSCNLGEVIAIFLNIVLGGPVILLPVQILWMNLVTDGLSALALGMEPADADVMRRPPRLRDVSIVGRRGARRVALIGGAIGCLALVVFRWLAVEDPIRAQTVTFTALVAMQLAAVFTFRTQGPSRRGVLRSNPWLIGAVTLSAALQLAVVTLPPLQRAFSTTTLTLVDWGIVAACCVALTGGVYAVRALQRRSRDGSRDR